VKVTSHVRITLPDGKRKYCPPVYGGNKKLKAGYALVNGKPELHPEGVFALRYSDRGKRKWEHVGQDPAKALTAKLRREHVFTGRAIGKPVAYDPQPTENTTEAARKPLAVAVEDYVADIQARRKHKTANAYEKALELFVAKCSKKYLDEITREDLLHYSAALAGQGNGARTVANRLGYITTLLRQNDVAVPPKKGDKPKFTKRAPNSCSKEFLQSLFAACNPEQRLVFRFFLLTGCREQEVSYACWSDIDLSKRTLTVREKADLGWTLKDYEERSIPLPSDLVLELKARRAARPNDRLIFPTAAGKTEGHFLCMLKLVALKTGLNCGHCKSKNGQRCSKHAVCTHIELHRFRRTFATMHHESGTSPRTIERWLGHSDLETTLRYLAAADDNTKQVRERVDQAFSF
jgi:integrase/recombinase XerD